MTTVGNHHCTLGRFLNADREGITPWMAGSARGKLVEEWARDCIKVPLGWENINEFFTRPLFAKLAEKLSFAGDRGDRES